MDNTAVDLTESLLSTFECPVCIEYMSPPIHMCATGHNICKNCKPKTDDIIVPQRRKMDNTAVDLTESLLSTFECPVCMEYMSPPIHMCANGHNICKNCKPKLANCPTCNRNFIKARCFALEELSQKNFPCVYKEVGCQESLKIDSIAKHQEVCKFRTYSCPLNKFLRCSWQGTKEELLTHVTISHPGSVQIYEQKTCMILPNYDIKRQYVKLIVAHNEVLLQSITVRDGVWYYLLQYIGPKEKARKFNYSLSFDYEDANLATITIEHCSRSFMEDIGVIYRDCMCIMVPSAVIQKFVQGGKLFYYLEIKNHNVTNA